MEIAEAPLCVRPSRGDPRAARSSSLIRTLRPFSWPAKKGIIEFNIESLPTSQSGPSHWIPGTAD
eukprot:scaffold77599_cov33-Tisochrysis_lutea.AAC.4